MERDHLYKHIENHVRTLFNNHKDVGLVYHTLKHTENVVERTKEIAAHYHVEEDEMLVLYTAAWFHDTGYLIDFQEHEKSSVQLMRSFMLAYTQDESLLNNIENCIMATEKNTEPETLLQQIICDADTYHLGTNAFKKSNKQVRKERELREGNIDKVEWITHAIAFMEMHRYYTSYCKQLLEKRKQKNLDELKESLKKQEAKQAASPPVIEQKNSFMTKGIQTMLRLTSENHIRLSDMADRKASILISVNSIIISVILSVLVRRLGVETYLTIPTFLFLGFSVVTIVISILATRPKITEGTFSDTDIAAKKVNLLFFGNFYKTSLDEYQRAMKVMMSDSNYLYGSLIKDIYFLGVVLGRKYKLIRMAYTIFMIGIILSVIAFGLAMVYAGSTPDAINSSSSPL